MRGASTTWKATPWSGRSISTTRISIRKTQTKRQSNPGTRRLNLIRTPCVAAPGTIRLSCCVAARVASDRSWKMQDPQMPKSIWYLTDAQWLGFRLVRPLKVPDAKEMYQYWNSGVEKE